MTAAQQWKSLVERCIAGCFVIRSRYLGWDFFARTAAENGEPTKSRDCRWQVVYP
jgi:hypothetical protein